MSINAYLDPFDHRKYSMKTVKQHKNGSFKNNKHHEIDINGFNGHNKHGNGWESQQPDVIKRSIGKHKPDKHGQPREPSVH